ncbi:MAG: hydroxyacylglutathione hydrolase [Sandaracinus sp.]|nr:hydroxyacylglutathione hydrolase [Sandaracinus sp.]
MREGSGPSPTPVACTTMPPMQHVVTEPRAPFRTADGALEIHQIPAARDNLIWLAVCTATGAGAAVDGPGAGEVLDYCAAKGIELKAVWNTHTHWDHIGVNADLQKRGKLEGLEVFGPAKKAKDVPGLTRGVDEGDVARIGKVEAKVMLTEGHIDGHVSFVASDAVFCGDTMFAGGCGYLFDGPPEKMHRSLERLAELEGGTRVCCAHEYTQANLRFAWSVEPDNEALAERIRAAWALRAKGGCTVPSTIAEERATNPFLRHHSATLKAKVAEAFPERDLSTPVAVFAATRALKDRKDYEAIPDSALPIG